MVEGKYVTLPVDIKGYADVEWFILFKDTFQNLKPSINRQIRVLNLTHIYCFDSVQNDIYIAMYKLYINKKLKFDSEDSIFIYIKQNGSKSSILNLEGWLRKTIANHLKKVRNKRNSIESHLNIDDCHVMREQSVILCLEHTEIKDKLKCLGDEDRRIIELFCLYDIPYKEIVEIFIQEGFGKFTVSTLRKKKERALDKLRSIY